MVAWVKGWFIKFFSYWLDSLKIFIPKNFKLFGLVTLKTIIETYKTLFKYNWWLLTWCLALDMATYFSGVKNWYLFVFVRSFSWILFWFIVFLTIRPSVDKKSWKYYCTYIKHFLLFLVSGFFAIEIFIRILRPILMFVVVFSGIIPCCPFLSPFVLIFSFFFLDSDGSLKSYGESIWRTVKMVWCNYPFFLIMFIVMLYGFMFTRDALIPPMHYILKLFTSKGMNLAGDLAEDIAILLSIIPVCFVANFYTKKVHDQFTLYFETV